MKNFCWGSLLLTFVFFLGSCQNETDKKISINYEWKFKLLDESSLSEEDFHKTEYGDSGWNAVSLPHTANIEPLVVNNQWQGTCWYRKLISIPETYEGKMLFLEFEAAMNHSKIWINGILVTEHQGGYLPVVIDATKHLKPGKKNLIAVRLNNTDNAITGPKPLKILDFNMYGGLYRNAWLIAKEKVYISHPVLANKTAGGGIFITTPKVSENESIVQVKTHIINKNNENVSVELIHNVLLDGKLVETIKNPTKTIKGTEDAEIIKKFPIKNPKLWSPKEPNLYTLVTSVYSNGELLDSEESHFGIRKFEFKNNELYINGNKTFLRGVNRHQEYPFIGYALSDNAQYRDAKKIKDAGFNCIRLSHYPHSPSFMDACDKLGIVVLDAILGWQYYLDNDLFREYCYRSARELILRDRNHPCVLAWETSLNETNMPIYFMEELHKIVHTEYPGKNVYSCGWMNDVYDIYLQARQHRLQHYDSIQKKPYFVSEYGDWEYFSLNAGLNQHKHNREKRTELSSRQSRAHGEERLLTQARNVHEAHNDNLNTPAFGDGYWVMYDYNRGYAKDIEYSGIMDIFRLPKFAYSFYKSQQNPQEELVLDIASYWNSDSPLDVKVYSNCNEVALYLNNKLIGKQKPDADSISNNLSHPPFTFEIKEFEAGTLSAVGLIDGVKAIEHTVQTPEEPVELKIWLDESGVEPQAGCNDVLFLYIAAIDKNGTITPEFDEKITLEISGDIQIMNKGELIVEAGIATALIRIGDSKEKVNIVANSHKLKSKDFVFSIK